MTPRETAAVTLHPAGAVVRFGAFRFDRANGLLARDGVELPLPPRALAVLSVLVDRAGRVVSKQELLDQAWNGAYVTETSLSEAVSLLRQTLGDDSQRPEFIQTVHRRGYRFIAALEAADERTAHGPLAGAPATVPSGPWLVPPANRLPEPAPHAQPDAPETVAAPAPPAIARQPSALPGRVLLALGVIAVLGAAVVGYVAGREHPRAAAAAAVRFGFMPPPGLRLAPYDPSLAVSPDGRHVVFAAGRANDGMLYDRDLGSLRSRAIAGTRHGMAPFFSPDGHWLGFFADGELRRVPFAGGGVVTIAAANGERASWSDDGTIVFADGECRALFRVPAAGGTPRRLTRPDPEAGEKEHFSPQVLPGGQAVIFTVWSSTLYDARVEWLSLVDGERRTLVRGGGQGFYAGGRLLWADPEGTVLAAPFDAARGRLTGPAAPLLAGVLPHPFVGFAQMAAAGDTLVYLPSPSVPMGERRLAWLPGDSSPHGAGERTLPLPLRFYRNLKTSAGGLLAATVLQRDRSDVWVIDPVRGSFDRLTFDGFNIEPTWSPDGQWVAYSSNRDGAFNVYRRRVDGSAPAERLLRSPHHQHASSWSPDGRQLMIGEANPDTGYDLWVLDLTTRALRPVLRTKYDEFGAVWSPDGRWIAYSTDESGRWEVVVRTWPDFGGRWQVSTEGGFQPFWSADGRTLYFHHDDVWAVPVAPSGRELHPGVAQRITHREDLAIASWAPDGGVYAVLEQRPPEGSPAEVRVVLDWQAALPPLR